MFLFEDFFPKSVQCFISDRSVDFALSKDAVSLNEIQENYFRKELGRTFNLASLVTLRQVHGGEIIFIKDRPFRYSYVLGEGDGLVTNNQKIVLSIRVADCLPVFVCDERRNVFGLIHAGWRSSERAIVANAIKGMKRVFKTDPLEVKVGFGPCIRPCCYEVGGGFKEIFPREVIKRGKKLFLDLVEINRRQLLEESVKIENIYISPFCTFCNDAQFFSHRREGEKAGRMIVVMKMER